MEIDLVEGPTRWPVDDNNDIDSTDNTTQITRLILGKLILLLNWVFTPRSITRNATAQEAVDQQTDRLALYQYQACPFCVKVRRAMKRNGLNIETRDVKRSESARDELLSGGGNLKVPRLRIEASNLLALLIYNDLANTNHNLG